MVGLFRIEIHAIIHRWAFRLHAVSLVDRGYPALGGTHLVIHAWVPETSIVAPYVVRIPLRRPKTYCIL